MENVDLERRVGKLEDEFSIFKDNYVRGQQEILSSLGRIEGCLETQKEKSEMQIQVDTQKMLNFENKVENVETRVDKLEGNQKWFVTTIVGEFIAILFMIIKAYIQKGI